MTKLLHILGPPHDVLSSDAGVFSFSDGLSLVLERAKAGGGGGCLSHVNERGKPY